MNIETFCFDGSEEANVNYVFDNAYMLGRTFWEGIIYIKGK